jgi:hypothetical protein
MAKVASGEVSLKAGGEDYLLRLDIQSMMDLEDALDASIIDLANEWSTGKAPRMGHIVAILRAAVVSHDLDVESAGALLLGHMDKVSLAISACFERSFKLGPDTGKPKPAAKKKPAK